MSESQEDWKGCSFPGWPDWCDQGRPVEIEMDDGTVIAGTLDVDDWFPTDDGDEVPVFAVIDAEGNKHSFASNKRWRFKANGR